MFHDAVYVAGRKDNESRSLLDQPHIYATESMRARRESQARSNIAREWGELLRDQDAS